MTSEHFSFLLPPFEFGFRCNHNDGPPVILIISLYLWYQVYFVIIIVEFLATVLSIAYLRNIFWGWTVPLRQKHIIFLYRKWQSRLITIIEMRSGSITNIEHTDWPFPDYNSHTTSVTMSPTWYKNNFYTILPPDRHKLISYVRRSSLPLPSFTMATGGFPLFVLNCNGWLLFDGSIIGGTGPAIMFIGCAIWGPMGCGTGGLGPTEIVTNWLIIHSYSNRMSA